MVRVIAICLILFGGFGIRPALAVDPQNDKLSLELANLYVRQKDFDKAEQELKNAIKEADANDFASDQEVDEVFNKWNLNTDLMATDSLEKPRQQPWPGASRALTRHSRTHHP